MLRLFTLFNLSSILCVFYHDPVIRHVSINFTTAAACSCCIVLPQIVHLTVLNVLHDL